MCTSDNDQIIGFDSKWWIYSYLFGQTSQTKRNIIVSISSN